MKSVLIDCPLCSDPVIVTHDGLGGFDAEESHDKLCGFVWIDSAELGRLLRAKSERG